MNKLVLAAGVVAGIGCYTLASAEIRIVTRTTTTTRALTAKGQADEAQAARAAPPAAPATTSVRTVSRNSDGDRTITRIKSDGSSVLQQRSRRELAGGKGVEKDSETLTVKPDGTFVDRTVNRTITW